MRKQLIATKAFSYAGKALKPGAEFTAGDSDARLLVAIKKARYQTRVMAADTDYATKAMQAPAPVVKSPAATSQTLRTPERAKHVQRGTE